MVRLSGILVHAEQLSPIIMMVATYGKGALCASIAIMKQ